MTVRASLFSEANVFVIVFPLFPKRNSASKNELTKKFDIFPGNRTGISAWNFSKAHG
jgi:hypothetical protein